MLKIQLCPESELEDEHWYTYDLLGMFIVGLVAWMAGNYILNEMRHEISNLGEATVSWNKEITDTKPMVAKFETLKDDLITLEKKVAALRHITRSHPEKLRPIVVMDQLQTLRPAGLWYMNVEFTEKSTIKIIGSSGDSLLISEFLLGLRETMNPDTWTNDLRTQSGFKGIIVKEVKRVSDDPLFKDLTDVLVFEATADVSTKVKASLSPSAMAPLPRSTFGARF